MTWSRHSRRSVPIRRSAIPFCQGDPGLDFKANKEKNYFDALKDIKQPVLIANGKFDPSYPLMNSYVLEREIPNSKLIAYPDAGHGFLFQYHRQFVPELLAFLDS